MRIDIGIGIGIGVNAGLLVADWMHARWLAMSEETLKGNSPDRSSAAV